MSDDFHQATAAFARRFGSPAYVYDVAAARASYALLRAAIPAIVDVAYSLKANPHPALVRTLAESGCCLEVSSAGELAVAAAAGRPLIFTGPGKSDAELSMAIGHGCVISVESPTELARIRAIAERLSVDWSGIEVILRINPDEGFDLSGVSMAGETPFGFSAAASHTWKQELERTGVRAVGYHVYGGSNMTGVDGLVRYFRAAVECITQVNRLVGLDVRILDLGGGFPAPYASPGTNIALGGLREALDDLFTAEIFGSDGDRPRIVVESGRFLTATCGTLVTAVRDIKYSAGGTRFVVLDAGVNHLGGMSALRRIPPAVAVPAAVTSPGSADRPARLVGPLCTPLDVLNLRAMLPDALSIGDVLAIPNVGAYGLTASLIGFLGRELPVEIVVDGTDLVEATRLTLTRAAREEVDVRA